MKKRAFERCVTRSFTGSIMGAALVCGLCGAIPAQAQNTQENIARAQRTLTEISKLLDAIASRQAAGVTGSTHKVENNIENRVKNRVESKVESRDLGKEIALFDGNTLMSWRRTDFVNAKQVHVEKAFRGGPAAIVVEAGDPLNGITWAKAAETLPRTNYEVSLEAMKIEGDDFLCGLTFPVGDSYATLILGGWGGSMVGISSIDGMDASENETSKIMTFPKNQWFAIRMRVTPEKLETWLDGKKIIDAKITGKRIGLRFGEISKSVPLGFATYQTSAAYRSLKLRRIDPTPNTK